MPIEKGERFKISDVYVDYPLETVMFRCDHKSQKIYRKFYGKFESRVPISHDSDLFNQALLYGDEISWFKYILGSFRATHA